MQVPLNTIGVFYCPKRASLRTFLSAARVALKILKTNDELYFRHCVCHFRQIFQVQYVFAPKNCGTTTFLDEKKPYLRDWHCHPCECFARRESTKEISQMNQKRRNILYSFLRRERAADGNVMMRKWPLSYSFCGCTKTIFTKLGMAW